MPSYHINNFYHIIMHIMSSYFCHINIKIITSVDNWYINIIITKSYIYYSSILQTKYTWHSHELKVRGSYRQLQQLLGVKMVWASWFFGDTIGPELFGTFFSSLKHHTKNHLILWKTIRLRFNFYNILLYWRNKIQA